jgi:endonuclease YncB( thermonuclease family)
MARGRLSGMHGNKRGSVAQQVHDGDTIILEAAGNLSARFLGIDTPEVSLGLPGSSKFLSIGGKDWDEFLADPFNGAPSAFIAALGNDLHQHLQAVTGPGCSSNHAYHANNAHRHLEELVEQDMQKLSQDSGTFKIFLAFSHEIMDGYGRFLCFINRNQEDANSPENRPRSYNERMLEAGLACPYFIWPNVNPFRREFSLIDAVPLAGNINDVSESPNGLGLARQWVKNTRQSKIGLFQEDKPLKLEPFELRFLSRRSPPKRWVIDLSNPNTIKLLNPTNYHTIPNSEDRLFVPEEFAPMFVEKGWQKQNL